MPKQLVRGLDLNTDATRMNLLVNGGFEIWQRGTSRAGLTVNNYGPDGWYCTKQGTAHYDLAAETTIIDAGSGTSCYVHLWGASADSNTLTQTIKDATLIPQLRGRTVTFSIRANLTSGGGQSFNIQIVTDTGGTVNSPYYPTGGSGWLTMTVTATIPTNATRIDLNINIQNASALYLDNASFVVGAIPADYVPFHPADELTRCLRYYEFVGSIVNYEFIFSGYAGASGQTFYFSVPYKVTKVVTPTITKIGATWGVSQCNQPVNDSTGPQMARFSITSTAASPFYANANAAGYGFTAEANP